MEISFDVQPILDNEKTGIGYFQYWILNNMFNQKENNYYLELFSFKNREEKIKNLQNFKERNGIINECKWFPGSIYKMIWAFLPVSRNIFIKNKSDITHFFNYYVPPGKYKNVITTVYDMSFMSVSHTTNFKTKIMLNRTIKKSCERADKIMTISEFSKSEIIKYLNIPEEKIFVVPCGVNKEIFHEIKDSNLIKNVKKNYGIANDYFLYLGTLEPRKNLVRLIEAYDMFRKSTDSEIKLVLAGRKGWYFEEIFESAKKSKYSNDIIFTGYVNEQDVVPLINGAFSFVFPSIYEGFGMPVLEAMACGTPVVTSNSTSLNEYFGDSSITVNPYDVETIKNGLEEMVSNEDLRKDLIERGLRKAETITWENSANMILDEYQKLVGE